MAKRRPDPLEQMLDTVLADGLPANLKATIDAALEAGCPKAAVLARVRRRIGPCRPGQTGWLTLQGVRAYLEAAKDR